MFFFKSSSVLWQHHPPVTSLLLLKRRASPAITTRAPGLPGSPPPTLNLCISQHSIALVLKCTISPQKSNFCTARADDICSRAGRTTQTLKHTESTLRMAEGPWSLALVAFSGVKATFVARRSKASLSAQGLTQSKVDSTAVW